MKKIEAVFLPFKLNNVHDVLLANNVHEYIVIEINAHEIEQTLKLELATNDRNATAIACAIAREVGFDSPRSAHGEFAGQRRQPLHLQTIGPGRAQGLFAPGQDFCAAHVRRV